MQIINLQIEKQELQCSGSSQGTARCEYWMQK